MGWWGTNKTGYSFTETKDGPEMVWGDGPADFLDAALDRIKEEFQRDWDRQPTDAELRAGLEFSLGKEGDERAIAVPVGELRAVEAAWDSDSTGNLADAVSTLLGNLPSE